MGFTPGPWSRMATDATVDDNYDSEDGGQQINTYVGVGNKNVRRGMVAIVVDYAGESSPLLDANARLIAAAPDLFEALQALVVAVTYADPPTLFNDVLCHEARVPVEFVTAARAALDAAFAKAQS